MIQKTIVADLNRLSFTISENKFTKASGYGRGLAVALLKEYGNMAAGRFDEDNPLIFVPGLFVGSSAPSSCRMHVVTKREKGQGAHISNITGDAPHRLISSGVSALVIKGKAKKPGTVLLIDHGEPQFIHMPELMGLKIPEIISCLREQFGEDCSITGTGPAADALLPLSTVFNTYPRGLPAYGCPRNSFGDIAGSKNLKAVVVKSSKLFDVPYADKEAFKRLAPKLSAIIRSNKICGGALPGYGSITIMKLLKNKHDIPEPKKIEMKARFSPDGIKINRNCSPVCVIGCLNKSEREALVDGFQDVPEVSEVDGALMHSFSIKDNLLVQKIMAKAFEIGINATEFVYTAKVYYEALYGKTDHIKPDDIYELLLEIEKLSVTGRVIAGGSQRVFEIFKDKTPLEELVTKPSITQEKNYSVSLEKPEGLENTKDIDLLYREIFALENLGICIFTSFALLNNNEALALLSKMFTAKTGIEMSVYELLEYSKSCIENELSFHKDSALYGVNMTVPEFTKVLYRYFGEEKEK